MLANTYHALATPSSFLASGYTTKSKELGQSTFIQNSTTDLYGLIEEVEHQFATLETCSNDTRTI